MFAKVGLQLTRTPGSVEPYGMRRLVSAGRSSMFCCLAVYSTAFWLTDDTSWHTITQVYPEIRNDPVVVYCYLSTQFLSIKMLARSSRHCEYPDQSRGNHFTMLTPRENLDVDSEDSEPAPHRHSGFRVVAEGGLQLSQFLTRISNKRSSEIRVYSFQSRKPLPMTTKMGDLPLKMSIQIWSEDLAKAIEDGLKSCHVKSADKDDAKDYKVFFIRHISSWEFFDSCETDRAQQDRRIQQLSDEVNSLRTRLENLERAQGTRWWGGYLMIGGHFFPSALLRKALAPHCCDFGWLIPGGQDSQLCHA